MHFGRKRDGHAVGGTFERPNDILVVPRV